MSDNLKVADDLHRDIMNLCCNEFHAGTPNQKEQAAYGRGFKDARHKAAELASEYTSQQQVSEWERKQLEQLRAQVAMLSKRIRSVVEHLNDAVYAENRAEGKEHIPEIVRTARIEAKRAIDDAQAAAQQFIAECEQRGAVKALEPIHKLLHYPDCWDTAAYPTLIDAITEISHCTVCEDPAAHGVEGRATSKKAG